MTSLPRFIQISTLTTYPASLLNRDDSGLSKRMPFGGHSRTRISSQCLKRHWRMADGLWSLKNVDPDIAASVRSRKIFPLLVEQPLIDEGCDRAKTVAVSAAIQGFLYGKKDGDAEASSKKKAKAAPADIPAEVPLSADRSELVVLGHREIEFIKGAVRTIIASSESAADAAGKASAYFKEHKKEFLALKCGAGFDAAMFGRFMSGDPDARVNAAVHVAHAFSVHAEESETDYFTAVDDLDPNHGSAHINATELTSGIFYGYVVIDVPLLISNVEGCDPKDWEKADRIAAGRLIKHLLHLIATVTPGAKLGSTAPYARPWLILAEAGDEQPRTLADAFYTPVPFSVGDPRTETVNRLCAYLEECDRMYGSSERRWAASMCPQHIPGANAVTLAQMGDQLEQAVVKLEL
ncbi:MAG: type I-E CRISPR-associated protein Cas7/Cse4/CasC [Pyramidobacter sp.]|nr:type I-E CRISPR-associated protein Cas7/Cse4/CasC [Pyramidobacter sp.]